jgi:hypothetical protein
VVKKRRHCDYETSQGCGTCKYLTGGEKDGYHGLNSTPTLLQPHVPHSWQEEWFDISKAITTGNGRFAECPKHSAKP